MHNIMIQQKLGVYQKKVKYYIKEENRQQNVASRILNKITDTDMHDIEEKLKYSRMLAVLFCLKYENKSIKRGIKPLNTTNLGLFF